MTNPIPCQITVIDSIMGSGKTSWMINTINSSLARDFTDDPDPKQRFLYVAPLLEEVERIKAACNGLNFRDPQPVHGKKFYHLKTLIKEDQNVCTTHALFSMLDQEVYSLLKSKRYTLVIDETITCVDLLKTLSATDRKILFREEMVFIEEGTSKLRWRHDLFPDYIGKFEEIRNLCDNGNLVVYRPRKKDGTIKSGDPVVLIWEFPVDFLQCFEQVYVLTYLFDGSPMKAYLQSEGVGFVTKAVSDGKLIDVMTVNEAEIKAKLRSLITVYEGKMNGHGKKIGKTNPFSSTWYDGVEPGVLHGVRSSIANFFKCVAKTPSKLNAWTTFNKARVSLTGEPYGRGFIPVNTKATNKHKHKRSMAYLCNIFHQPVIKGFFEDKGIPIREELHALSEMIQWIWRSQIREHKPITVYIPSERMRSLFLNWLNEGMA